MQLEKVNPKMITLARDIRYMSQKDLTDMVEFTQGKLSKIENGLLRCSEDDINLISRALNFSVNFFYQTDTVYGLGVSQLYYRKKKSATVKELKYFESLFQFRRMQISRLLKSVDMGDIDIKEFSLEEYKTPTAVAKIVRAMWHIPSGPISNVVETIENVGGIVFSENVKKSKIDAMSQWITQISLKDRVLQTYEEDNIPPLFFINTSKPMDRIRFSLCHEIGHTVMHRIPNENMENEANEFAAEFLMPEDDIRDQLKGLTFDKLADLKLHWKVSMAALIHRAGELKCITQNQAKYLFMKLSSMGYRMKEPEHLLPTKEVPGLLRSIIDVYFNELSYTKEELYNLVFLNDDDAFDLLYDDKTPRLRLVK
jgi:Zn-dependent peptidase ImmA (M78 family)